MYQMSAAHPTLPIPSYARVTNLSNGKQVIVRVNDRGPFHSNRVIDLSYTAALQLGYISKGSAELQVERLLPADIEQILAAKANGQKPVAAESSPVVAMPAVETATLPPPIQLVSTASAESIVPQAPVAEPITGQAAASPAAGFYLQFGAYAQEANAEALRTRLLQDGGSLPALKVESSNNLYRLYSGPFTSRDAAAAAAMQFRPHGIKPIIVQRQKIN